MLSRKQLALLAIGTSLSFWDIFNVPYIVNAVSSIAGFSSSLILTAELTGYFTGGIINGYIASVKGRKLGLLLSMIVITIGSLIGFLSTNLVELLIAEFIIGIGIEGEITMVSVYVSEMSEANNRGKSVGLTTLGGFLMSLVVGPYAIIVGNNWKLLFLPSLIIAIIALIVRLHFPESIIWLNKRKTEKFSIKLNKSTLIFFIIWFTSYFAGYSLFSAPIFSLISEKGFQDTSLYFTYILYGDPLGVIIGSLVNDKIERKFSSFITNFASGILIAIIAIIPLLSGFAFLAVGFLTMFLQGFKFPSMYAYTAENFKTEIRSLSYGIADGIGHSGGAVGPIIFTSLFSINPTASFLVLGLVSMISGIMIVSKGIKTKGKSIEELDVVLSQNM